MMKPILAPNRTYPSLDLDEEAVSALFEDSEKVGFGNFADVFRVHWQQAPVGCGQDLAFKQINKRVRERSQQSPLGEMEIQYQIYEWMEQARQASPQMAFALVPEPEFYICFEPESTRSPGHHLIAMAFIPGKTLFRLILEHVARNKFMDLASRQQALPLELDAISNLSESSLTDFILSEPGVLLKHGVRITVCRILKLTDRWLPPFLPGILIKQIKHSLAVIHQKGCFHRDLHEKNVLISDDFRQAWIIDFDSAIRGSTRTDAYTRVILNDMLRFTNDNDLLVSMRPLTLDT